MKNYRSTIVGFGVLIVLMTAGAAQSLSGSNTVYTDDIVNNHVTNADLGPNSVSRSKIAADAVAGSEVTNGSVGTVDLADNAISSSKIAAGAVYRNHLGSFRGEFLNFGSVNAGACTWFNIFDSAAVATSQVLASPPLHWSESFTFNAWVYEDGRIKFAACNQTASAADPDGASGGTYHFNVINPL